ncbi:hypothetical protein [Chryseobacterium sp. OSA05B]|uniref:hypothetical protein n=1 Tax=Chryseobacterium sp. OSA05B TaxID=2862650 RepID=UPI001CC099A1|nr:hypothetical protein [Chryseobacterium sp. OSA05B]
MYSKYYTLILIFFFYSIFGQLRLELRLTNSIAKVTIYNESKENYVLPIDAFHFRPYEDDCNNLSDHELEFPSFGLMVNIIKSTGKKEDYTIGYYKTSENFDSISNNINIKRSSFQKKISKWGKNNNIKDYNVSLINYNLINNLIYLKPKGKFSFNIKLDLYNITAQELIFYNYILEKSENYKFNLSLCEFKEIDRYLTSSQKYKLKKYKLFTKKLESNFVELKQ